MASSNRIFAFNLGTQVVRLAEFRRDDKGGLTLAAYQTSELLADPAADATRIGQTGIAVQELVSALKATGQTVNYAIPSQPVFIRFVALPPVDKAKVEQIVTFEAQQNIPFPLEEVVWDYQVLPAAGEGKQEVVISAIKVDLLEEINLAVEGSKVRTGIVDVAPMALYNAFRYNYSDATGCNLLIDIGSRTTNLVFIEGKRVFTRTINIGGNTITGAIAKEFEESFAEAEARKKAQGFVSLSGYAEPDDPDAARISKVIRNMMTRLHADISRSITYYRSQQGGGQPVRVFLAGGGASMPYVREFFAEKLGLPIEFFNPLRNVSVSSNINPEEIGQQAHMLGELVGLALRSTSACPMELSLAPHSVARRQEMAARRPFLIAAGVCLLAALGGLGFFYSTAANRFAEATQSVSAKVDALNQIKQQIASVQEATKRTQASVQPLLKLLEERDYWVQLLDELNTRLPDRYIWITELSYQVPSDKEQPRRATPARRGQQPAAATPQAAPEPKLVVRGFYLLKPDYRDGQPYPSDDFYANLQGSEFFNIVDAKKNEIYDIRTTGNTTDNSWTFAYGFVLPLKKTIAQ